MKDVEQMTCEELGAELEKCIGDPLYHADGCLRNLFQHQRSMDLLKELKSRRLAAGAG